MIKFVLLLSFAAVPVHAWGPIGHSATGIIAQSKLSPAALKGVADLIPGRTLGDIASWADTVKHVPALAHTASYHFEDLDDGVEYLSNLKSQTRPERSRGGVVEGILVAEQNLADLNQTYAQRSMALKFLVHFIGDLHQPLHTGRASDRGANSILVTWMGAKTNLHAVWDSGLLVSAHQDLFKGAATAEKGDRYARYLMSLPDEPSLSDDGPQGWLAESVALRSHCYDPRYISDQQNYETENVKVIDAQIRKAGIRIAAVLNRIFAKEVAKPVQSQFQQAVEMIVGPLASLIQLGPVTPVSQSVVPTL